MQTRLLWFVFRLWPWQRQRPSPLPPVPLTEPLDGRDLSKLSPDERRYAERLPGALKRGVKLWTNDSDTLVVCLAVSGKEEGMTTRASRGAVELLPLHVGTLALESDATSIIAVLIETDLVPRVWREGGELRVYLEGESSMREGFEATLRGRLAERYGDPAPGFLIVMRPWP